MARVSNDPRKRGGPTNRDANGKRIPKRPDLTKTLQTKILPANPPRPPNPPALAERILDNTVGLGPRTSIDLVLKEMDLAGSKKFELSDEMFKAVPAVAAKLMTKASTLSPSNDDLDLAERGAKLAIKAADYNLDRFGEANKTELPKVEQNINVSGNATFIIPAPVIGRLGEAPKTRE